MAMPLLNLGWLGRRGLMKELAGVAAAGMLVVAGLEYRDQAQAARAAETIRMIDRWEDPAHGILAGYQGLGRRLILALERHDPAADDQRAPEETAALLVSEVLGQDGAAEEFERVVYFFSRLELCVEARPCDEDTAAIFFSDTVDSFMRNFRGAILQRRKFDRHFGSEIRDLQIRLNRRAALLEVEDPDPPPP